MTVEAVSVDSVTCVWFDKNTPRERTFPIATLEDADRLDKLLEEIAREREGQTMPELSIVALRNAHRYEAGVLPPGTKGTIVHAYRDGAGYEVEFSEPFHCVVTVAHDDIELA
jgi:hypothetical protein